MLQTREGEPLQRLLGNPLTAVIYEDGKAAAKLLADIADRLKASGCSLAGYIQRERERDGRTDCDMLLEDIATGKMLPISEDRGAGARGCKLDVSALLSAGEKLLAALEQKPDMLILNKFGKTEHEGGGLRAVIARATELEVPVLIAVPLRHIESWREFSGGQSADCVAADFPMG